MRLPRHRTIWLSAVLLMVIGVGTWHMPRSRITQANYDRIQYGMTKQEVEAILGHGEPLIQVVLGGSSKPGFNWVALFWRDGPTYIRVRFDNDRVAFKDIYPATAWESLKWHAMKGAKKIGVKWD